MPDTYTWFLICTSFSWTSMIALQDLKKSLFNHWQMASRTEPKYASDSNNIVYTAAKFYQILL